MLWLKQSTAATVKIGPFIDSTDFITPLTSLTISQADIRLSKNGGAFAQTNNATGATSDASGWYGVPLDTTDTNTLGRLQLFVAESGALQVWAEFMVLPAGVYDALITNSGGALVAGITGNLTGNVSGSVGSVTGAVGSVTGAVGSVTGAVGSVTAVVSSNLTQVNGSTAAADRFKRSLDCMALVTIGVGSTLTNIVTSAIDVNITGVNQIVGAVLYFPGTTTTPTVRYARTVITAMTAAGVFTVEPALPAPPVSGDIAEVL